MNAFLKLDPATMLPLLVGLSAGLLLIVATLLLSSFRNRRTVQIRSVLESDPSANLPNLRRDDTDSSIPTLDRAVKRWLPRREKLRERLLRTGLPISIGHFLLTCAFITAATIVVCARIVGLPVGLAVPIGLIAGCGLPYFAIWHLGNRRTDRFNRLFPEAIDIMVRGLRAGMPMGDSIQIVGRELASPVGPEFRMIEQAITVGQPLDVAMSDAAKRIITPEFQFFVVSLALQRETGGNLSETLANLSDILRRRRQMRLKIKAMSSEARASAWIIGMLPFAMFFVIMWIRPDYVAPLFSDPRGVIMACFGVVSIVIGIFVMNKMMRFEI